MRGGSSDGKRAYRGQDGGYSFYEKPYKPWLYRSTVNESPWWGLRSGTAVESERQRFSNRSIWRRKGMGYGRLSYFILGRTGYAYYPDRHSSWD